MITLAKEGSPGRPAAAAHCLHLRTTSKLFHSLFDKAQERYGERQGGYTRIIQRLPRRRRQLPNGIHRAGLSALRQDCPLLPIRGFKQFLCRLAAVQPPSPVFQATPELPLARSSIPCVPMALRGRRSPPDSGCACERPGGVTFDRQRARSPPALAEGHFNGPLSAHGFVSAAGPPRALHVGWLVIGATYRRLTAYTLNTRARHAPNLFLALLQLGPPPTASASYEAGDAESAGGSAPGPHGLLHPCFRKPAAGAPAIPHHGPGAWL